MAAETYVPDNRFAGGDEAATTEITIASGQNLPALKPLGQVAATGEFKAWDPTANDGSQVATRMTAAAVDTSAGAKKDQAYKSGTFNEAAVVWPDGVTAVQKMVAFVGTPISTQMPG
ncbi:head decoration protein [Aliamphritea hakodatensis]|uniref:head decoration protein n=1 Tax=Aliamphritea hakodatensis TaxID=2895352 RepID=UPI0022FD76D5|nr:head decoration protein [Aliamphritea hakodatensis]